MSGTKPNFSHWKQLDVIEIWEAAALMLGYDPRSLGDVLVRVMTPDGPVFEPLNYETEVRQLQGSVSAGKLDAVGGHPNVPDDHTLITVSSLVMWLTQRGYAQLAEELRPVAGPEKDHVGTIDLPAHERRLQMLLELGGAYKWCRRGNEPVPKWHFTGIGKLIDHEVAQGFSRSSEKTVRRDLIEAANARNLLKQAGL